MKPLELTVHPPLTALEQESVRLAESTGLAMFHTPPAGFFEKKAKRLASAELAAEYWRNEGELNSLSEGYSWAGLTEGWPANEDKARERHQTLIRFATLPHYDEETS